MPNKTYKLNLETVQNILYRQCETTWPQINLHTTRQLRHKLSSLSKIYCRKSQQFKLQCQRSAESQVSLWLGLPQETMAFSYTIIYCSVDYWQLRTIKTQHCCDTIIPSKLTVVNVRLQTVLIINVTSNIFKGNKYWYHTKRRLSWENDATSLCTSRGSCESKSNRDTICSDRKK